jgi:hypothetical protein
MVANTTSNNFVEGFGALWYIEQALEKKERGWEVATAE